ncbi:hypothetical protein GY45DRAFT_120202 [Cubamyces sp. BRFM 1775]|nr:hypothetical protein GY45DRAFT_120202 [Cubamyces sp. BRFM 1775]
MPELTSVSIVHTSGQGVHTPYMYYLMLFPVAQDRHQRVDIEPSNCRRIQSSVRCMARVVWALATFILAEQGRHSGKNASFSGDDHPERRCGNPWVCRTPGHPSTCPTARPHRHISWAPMSPCCCGTGIGTLHKPPLLPSDLTPTVHSSPFLHCRPLLQLLDSSPRIPAPIRLTLDEDNPYAHKPATIDLLLEQLVGAERSVAPADTTLGNPLAEGLASTVSW